MQRRLYIYGERRQGTWRLTCLNLRLSATSETLADARDQLHDKVDAHRRQVERDTAPRIAATQLSLAWLSFLLCRLRLHRASRRICEVVDLDED